ncbi:hypothetical protein SISNIDRAFT_470992 [Sistotremastrum niveocremeum HHB9708]|uniref:ABM domain-containing protein n=2 Tax=Sistotremastraceae TaxID=3402574 RepID=A0A164N7E6_9AGAM|nr:hypothetical protein SISNIDRAFT_470992 [Sistotremastrum niveocremeum HHB9708]KZT38560.1 hypothetical protein SISSUDRAFT_1061913 [Sistotremastrum suecicum HHB10207 ss-3]
MSSDLANIKSGHIIVVAEGEAIPGKESQVAKHLTTIAALANSDAEPGVLVYRVVQYETKFVTFEEYVDAASVASHLGSKEFVAFQQDFANILVGGAPKLGFYSEIK